MPKVVDHADRRRELAEAAWHAIVKYGLDATTTRLIAKESGYSAGVLAHYFGSKDEILLAALRISHEGLDRRIREAIGDKEGLDALRTYCVEILPTSPVSVRETHLEMSMWSRALVNDDLRTVQRSEATRWRGFMEVLIVDAQRSGELVAMPPRTISGVLAAVINGLSIDGLLYPDRFDQADLIEFFDTALAAFRVGDTEATGPGSGRPHPGLGRAPAAAPDRTRT